MIEAERSLVLTADQRYGDCFRQDSLIVTLKTTDGFEVSFGIPFQTCRTLGFSLQHEANEAIAAGERDERGCRDRHPTKSSPTRRYRGQSIAIMTSDTLTTALTSLRSAMPRSLTASTVIEEAIRWPPTPSSPRPGECGRPSQAPGYKR